MIPVRSPTDLDRAALVPHSSKERSDCPHSSVSRVDGEPRALPNPAYVERRELTGLGSRCGADGVHRLVERFDCSSVVQEGLASSLPRVGCPEPGQDVVGES